MTKKHAKHKSKWHVLREHIETLEGWARADEMKGSGDPLDFDAIEASYKLAKVTLNAHIDKMEREEREERSGGQER